MLLEHSRSGPRGLPNPDSHKLPSSASIHHLYIATYIAIRCNHRSRITWMRCVIFQPSLARQYIPMDPVSVVSLCRTNIGGEWIKQVFGNRWRRIDHHKMAVWQKKALNIELCEKGGWSAKVYQVWSEGWLVIFLIIHVWLFLLKIVVTGWCLNWKHIENLQRRGLTLHQPTCWLTSQMGTLFRWWGAFFGKNYSPK